MARMPITFVASVSVMLGSIEYSCAEDLFKNADISSFYSDIFITVALA